MWANFTDTGLFGGQASAGQQGKGIRAMLRLDAFNLLSNVTDGVVIVHFLKAAGRASMTLIGVEQAVGMGTLKIALYPFGTQFALIKGKVVPRGSKPITSFALTLSRIPHCWFPQKQQWVATSLSGSTPLSRRMPEECQRELAQRGRWSERVQMVYCSSLSHSHR